MNFPAIQRNIFPIPIGRKPRFLSKGIKRIAKNTSNNDERLSAMCRFLMTSPIAVNKWNRCRTVLLSFASDPDDPAATFVLTAALFTKSASIVSNVIGSTCFGVSVSKTSNTAFLPCGCFCFNWFKVSQFSERIPSCMPDS